MNVRRDPDVLREELAALVPAPGEPTLPADRHSVLREYLMQEITDVRVGTENPALPRPISRRRRFAAIAAPLAVAATVVLGLAAAGTFGDTPPPEAPVSAAEHREAVRLLDRIATTAAHRPAVVIGDHQYIYTRSIGSARSLGADESIEGNAEREEWESVDGRREGLIRVGPQGAGALDNIVLSSDPKHAFRTYRGLPTDPDVLYEERYAATKGMGPTHEEALFEDLGYKLEKASLIPELSAALNRAAAKIPGIVVKERVTDAAGRAGIGLSFRGITWVFDREDLTYLGTTKTALLGVGVADRVGQQPGT
ncbi:CU044_5270 family protein [Streptomyces boninensis]|uniref:CU044_5270 family protein n=1 Tax=Streptomyces boninensis TaxID=2039455 RepID=UPI003B215C1F